MAGVPPAHPQQGPRAQRLSIISTVHSTSNIMRCTQTFADVDTELTAVSPVNFFTSLGPPLFKGTSFIIEATVTASAHACGLRVPEYCIHAGSGLRKGWLGSETCCCSICILLDPFSCPSPRCVTSTAKA